MNLTLFFPKHWSTARVTKWLEQHESVYAKGLRVDYHYFNHYFNRWYFITDINSL